jgi:hypothetical protein
LLAFEHFEKKEVKVYLQGARFNYAKETDFMQVATVPLR